MHPRSRLLAALAVALLAPCAQAAGEAPGIANPHASTPTRLHFHVTGALQDFPINTQPADLGYTVDGAIGVATHTLTCLPPGTPVDGTTQTPYATVYGFATPASVVYNQSGGPPRIHPERGLGFDALLDPAVAPVVDWYVTTFAGLPADNVNGVDTPHQDAVVPNVVARATVRTGEAITLHDEGYDSGDLVAQGQTAPTTLAGPATFSGAPGGAHPDVTAEDQGGGKGYVYGFHIPLAYASTTIPRAAGFNVRIDLFVSLPACDPAKGKTVMPNEVRVHSDAAHRPGLQLAVLEPLRITALHPQFLGDQLVLHTSEGSPWGPGDVAGVRVNITGPDGPVGGVYPVAVLSHEHSVRYGIDRRDFAWPFREQAAKDGAYTVRLEAANLQGTAHASAVAGFELGKDLWVTRCGSLLPTPAPDLACVRELQDGEGHVLDPSARSPGLQVAGLLGVLGVVAALRRRQD
jgi:hypothetical protein